MKDLLSRPQRQVLEQLASSSVLLGFDFDGTLAPIVADPARAALAPRTRRLLCELARIYPCVVISGRAVSDLERRLAGIELHAVLGNHGLEPTFATAELARLTAGWERRLAALLAGCGGVVVENKTCSLAIHYRRSRARRRARAAILRAVATLGEARVIGGKQVVNVLPPGAPHKGIALERERLRAGCERSFFAGDDETDEEVFALERRGRLLAVRVGPARGSRASYCLRRQSQMDELLSLLIELRRRHGTEARRIAR